MSEAEFDPNIYRQWHPSAQEKVAEALRRIDTGQWRPFFCRVPMCTGMPHDDWTWNHARADQHPPKGDWDTWLLSGGRGCIAADTRIYLPLENRHERVDILAERGASITVMTRNGPRLTDGAPFVKGVAPLYRVETEDGRVATVTAAHRFATPQGWRQLADVPVGSLLASDSVSPDGRAGPTPLPQSVSGDPRSRRTPADCPESCSRCPDPDGRPPLRAEAGAQGWPLPLADGSGCSRSCSPQDGSGATQECSHACRRATRDDLPRSSCAPVAQPLSAEVYPALLVVGGQSLRTAPSPQRSLSTWTRTTSSGLLGPLARRPHPLPSSRAEQLGSPSPDFGRWSRVRTIRPAGSDVYYDLTVPGEEHYLAEGLWHHNSGKTRTGSEWTHRRTKVSQRIALIAPTAPDARDVMIEGESGILATAPPGGMPTYEPSKRKVTWPNGAVGNIYSGEEPDRLRGPQHWDAWLDEPAHMALIDDLWDNLQLGLRLGQYPRVCATTTPKPTKWLKELMVAPGTRVVRVATYANLSNLAPVFADRVRSRFEGTRKGRQELYGELLEDVDGALWNPDLIELGRVAEGAHAREDFDRVVVGVDPAGTANKRSDETGIVVVGSIGDDYYVLADYSGKYSPQGWASKTKYAYEFWLADKVVAEKNYGGDMVRFTLTAADEQMPVELVVSRRGKALRADPIVALYERGKVHHVGLLNTLEDQMTMWVPGTASPDRVDALVHGLTAIARNVQPASIALPEDLL